MPNIAITDNTGLNVSVSPAVTSSIAKYFKDELKLGFKDFNFAKIQSFALNALPGGQSTAGLTVSEPVNVGITDVQLKIGGGASAGLAVLLVRDNEALKSDVFGDPLAVPDDQAFVSFSISASIAADLGGKQNDLSFGFNAGSQIQFTNAKPFALTPTPPTLISAFRDTLSNFVLPGDLEDLATLGAGAICTVQGTGTLKFNAGFQMSFLTNPLATASIPLAATPIQVSAGGSVAIAASVTVSGEYQIRAAKREKNTIRLGVYRKRASAFDVSVTPSFGVSASFGKTDLIEKLIGAVSANPQADTDALKAAGLDAGAIAAIESAVKGGVQRRLEVAVRAELSAESDESATFYSTSHFLRWTS